jgi:hypothetical protein
VRTLETERLRLEPLRAAHAGALFPGFCNRRLYAFLSEDPPPSLAALAAIYAGLELRRSPRGDEIWLNWVLLRKPELEARPDISGGSDDAAHRRLAPAFPVAFI